MKIAKIVLIVTIAAAVITWLRAGEDFPLPRVLPFCGGYPPSALYDVIGGIGIVLIFLWGLARLRRRERSDDDESEGNDV